MFAAAQGMAILGVLNGTVQWLFAFPGRLSVTVSAGDRLIYAPREELAKTIWGEVARLTGLPAALPSGGPPPWQIVRERRATFAATPAQDAKRPGAATPWRTRAGRLIRISDDRSGHRSGRRRHHRQPIIDEYVAATAPAKLTDAARLPDDALEQRIQETQLLAQQRPDGHWVFELEADATIPAEYVLLRHYLGEPVDAELEKKDRGLSAPHSGRPRRLAAVPRRRARHQRDGESLFRAEDDR